MSKVEENKVLQEAMIEATEEFVKQQKDTGIAEPNMVIVHYLGQQTLVLTDISESLAMIADAQMELVKQKRENESAFWRREETDNGAKYHVCSKCGFKYQTNNSLYLQYRYCPKCGRNMFGRSIYTRYISGEEVDTDGQENTEV